MSFCKLVQQHFTVVLPYTQRVELAVPLTDNQFLLVFSDSKYNLYDFITNQEMFKGELRHPVLRYHVVSDEEVLLIGTKHIQSFSCRSRQITVYSTSLQSPYSNLQMLVASRILLEVVELPTKNFTILAGHNLKTPGQLHEPFLFELVAATPMLVQLCEENLLLTVARAGNKVEYKQLMVSEDCTGVEVLQAGSLATEPDFNPIHVWFSENNLNILGTNREQECELLHYNLAEQIVVRKMRLFDSKSYMLHSIIGQVRECLAILKVSELGRFIDLITTEGKLIQSLRLDPKDSTFETAVNANRTSIFSFENSNERCFEKHKPDVPTLIKFMVYRAVSKQSLLAYLLHHTNSNIGPNGMNRVLQCLS